MGTVAIARAIEEREREAARERQRAHGGTAPGKAANTPGKFPEVTGEPSGRAADKVGAAVGMDRKTLQKAEAVVSAARADPERYGPIAEEMDGQGRPRLRQPPPVSAERASRPCPGPR